MTRHRMIDPATPQPVKSKRSSHGAKNSRKSVKVESTTTKGVNTPSESFDPPKAKPKAKNTPSEPVESIQTSDHDSVAGLSSNGNKGNLDIIRASTKAYVASLPQPVIREPEEDWLDRMIRLYSNDPLGFFREAWPEVMLEQWQSDISEDIALGLAEDDSIYRLAVASGRGIGKTRLLAMLFLWYVATHPHSQTTLTATTGRQISNRAWREVTKCLRDSRLYGYFLIQSSKCVNRKDDTWYGVNQTWSEERPESFQGSHEEYVGFFVDEASGVPDTILEAIESGLTDKHTFIAYFSNPTRKTGRFSECFPGGKSAHLWHSYNIDARDVERTNKQRIQEILDENLGDEDSSAFRIHVRGLFPLAGHDQLITEEMLRLAQERTYVESMVAPYIIGVDTARFGESLTVITIRQGARIIETRAYRGLDEVKIAGFIAETIDAYQDKRPTTFVEGVSFGLGAIDILRHRGYRIQSVNTGLPANNAERYKNKRAEAWDTMRIWIRDNACFEKEDRELFAQLTGITYHYDDLGRLVLESKEEMKSRGLASPDRADSLAMTFAERVAPRGSQNGYYMADGLDYDPRARWNVAAKGDWHNTWMG